MRPTIFSFVEVGHDTVDDVRLRTEQVDGVDIFVGGAAIGDLLNVWSKSGAEQCEGRREGGVLVMFSFRMAS